MSISQLAALAGRHRIAMLGVLVVTAAVAVGFRHTAPLYQDSGTVLFSTGTSNPNAIGAHGDDLIITADLIANRLSTSAAASEIEQAGGTGQYQFGLVNFYNEQYPNYSQPVATLGTTSYNPTVAAATFRAALQVINRELRSQQVLRGVRGDDMITAQLINGSSGPIALIGSPKRVYGALALLAIIIAYFIARFLDKHPEWRRHMRLPKS